jgi:hypothetical protein
LPAYPSARIHSPPVYHLRLPIYIYLSIYLVFNVIRCDAIGGRAPPRSGSTASLSAIGGGIGVASSPTAAAATAGNIGGTDDGEAYTGEPDE